MQIRICMTSYQVILNYYYDPSRLEIPLNRQTAFLNWWLRANEINFHGCSVRLKSETDKLDSPSNVYRCMVTYRWWSWWLVLPCCSKLSRNLWTKEHRLNEWTNRQKDSRLDIGCRPNVRAFIRCQYAMDGLEQLADVHHTRMFSICLSTFPRGSQGRLQCVKNALKFWSCLPRALVGVEWRFIDGLHRSA